MKAFYLTRFGSPDQAFELRQVDKPILKDHQLLVKVEAFGLNFADVLARRGLYPEVPPRPCVLGYDVVGRVEAAGKNADATLVGKRVVGLTRFGGYAEYAATDFRAVATISEGYPADKALALGTQYTTAYVCFHESMRLYAGDNVLVHAAAGGVGIALCQMALNEGCTVFGTAGSQDKLDFLKEIGVKHGINYRKDDYAEAIRKQLKGGRIDASFNSLSGKSVPKDMKLLGSGGKLVIYGAASRVGKKGGLLSTLGLLLQTGFVSPLSLIMRSKSMIGINILKLGDYKPHVVANAMKQVVAMAEAGSIEPVVGGVYKSTELNKAHEALENRGTVGKLGVVWD
jgi:NADPH2:quinone reductase